MTEKEKMLNGLLYDPSDSELAEMRKKAHKLCKQYNDTYEDEEQKRNEIISELLPNFGKGTYLQGPIQFDYGVFTTFGEKCYANFNLVVLDCCQVRIGSSVFFGPNCTIATPVHPMYVEQRRIRERNDGTMYNYEYAKPVTIEDDCWLASDVTVCGGVKIGKGSVIGAGSVVTRDIPANVFAAGNPCRVIRKITKDDLVDI